MRFVKSWPYFTPFNPFQGPFQLILQVCSTFSVNDQPHYQFTPRDLTQWVVGLKRCDSGCTYYSDVYMNLYRGPMLAVQSVKDPLIGIRSLYHTESSLRYDFDSLRLPEAVAHEAARVFRDRLVEGAADNFDSLLAAVLNSMINYRCVVWMSIRKVLYMRVSAT